MNQFTKIKFIKLGNFDVIKDKDGIYVKNFNKEHGFLIIPKIYKYNNKGKRIVFKGIQKHGDAPCVKFLNRKKNVLYTFDFNTESIISSSFMKYFIITIYVPENSEFIINEFAFDDDIEKAEDNYIKNLKNDILVITPGYPSESNKYNTAFVHSRVKEYQKNGLNVDVLCINSLPGISKYIFEGVVVLKGDYYFLRKVLSKKRYKKIAIHFFDHNYGNVLDSIDLTNTSIYLFIHGADVLYRSFKEYASPYFGEQLDLSNRENEFKLRDYYIRKYNNLENVKWIFVSEFIKNKLEKNLNIKIKNYDVIPNFIDFDFFKYSEKSENKRKKIFILRKFTNDFCYGLDIDIRVILELSRRKIFKDLEFDIYGSGDMFNIITAPVENFKNVHLHREFLTHDEMKKMQDNHGIALYASRFDTQGVSLCEAISSGCAVVSSKIDVISEYINSNLGNTCDVENYKEYADVIEKMVYDEQYFQKVTHECYDSVKQKFNYDSTIAKEISLLMKEANYSLKIAPVIKKPVLSIIIPSYNVEKYLWNGVMTLLNQKNANKIEILIINDGSKDATSNIGQLLEKKYPKIIRLISKENGGHGSTINVGISIAQGKYVKIMDGDDTLDSEEFSKLIDILEKEDSDVVLNNYIEDYYLINEMNFKNEYSMLIPGIKYNFEDLCYEGYGFKNWGPILSCSTYKKEFLDSLKIKLSEKCFYVDMELNNYISSNCNTITYYPLNVYRYLLGRNGQSISKESYMKNYRDHEKVIFNIIDYYYSHEKYMSDVRKKFILNKIILTMITTQHIVTIEFYNKSKPFRSFNKKLKKYPEIYNNPNVATRAVKFHRTTGGYLIFMNSFLVKLKKFFIR